MYEKPYKKLAIILFDHTQNKKGTKLADAVAHMFDLIE